MLPSWHVCHKVRKMNDIMHVNVNVETAKRRAAITVMRQLLEEVIVRVSRVLATCAFCYYFCS